MVLPFCSVFRVDAASSQSDNRMVDAVFVKRGKLPEPLSEGKI